jgi:hypothetical protein
MMMFEKNNKSRQARVEADIVLFNESGAKLRLLGASKIYVGLTGSRQKNILAIMDLCIGKETSRGNIYHAVQLNVASDFNRKPSKHLQALFHVKQIFMFIFCLKFMKQ